MRKFFSISALIAILAVSLISTGDALTQSSTTGVQTQANGPTLFVSNTCSTNALVGQIAWFVNNTLVRLQIVPTTIPGGNTAEYPFDEDGDDNRIPTTVQVTGSAGGQPFNLTVEANNTATAECVNASYRTGGTTDNGQSEVPNTQTDVPVPAEVDGLQNLTPDQAIATLQSRGVQVDVQGSQANPKLGNVDDPLILGALASGFQASAVWVSAPGQLRASVTYDQPNANIVMIVIGGGFCLSLSPTFLGIGGLNVSCDRAAALAPFTTIGGGPVPGFVFLVLTIKLGGPTLPYVLSLST